jgi:hypothetical protein
MAMRAPRTKPLSLLSLLAASGCTLLVGAQLSDKPAETGGAGGYEDGGPGSGIAGSSVESSNGQSSNGQSNNGQSSSSGWVNCPPNTANCDGIAAHGCDVNLKNDPDNCGHCNNVCMDGMQHCADGHCK